MSIPLAYIGVILIWTTTPLAIKWSGETPGFLFGVVARMVIGTTICYVMLVMSRQRLVLNKHAIKIYLAAALGIYGAMSSVYWGAQFIASGIVSVIFGLTPIVTGILAIVMLHEKAFTPRKVLGIALGLLGLVMIFNAPFDASTAARVGMLAVFVAMFLHSLSTVVVKRLSHELTTLQITTGGLLFSLPLYLLTWILSGSTWPAEIGLRSGLSIVYLGVVGSVVGFMLFFYILKHNHASRVGLIPLMTPVLALMLGTILNNEHIPYIIWAGSACILTGMAFYQWGHKLDRFLMRAGNKTVS